MPTPDLKGLTVAALMTDGFEQAEFTSPRDALKGAGATVTVVSPNGDAVEGWDEDDWGDTFDVDIALMDADPANYDALLLPGGQINPDVLRVNDAALAFIKAFFEADKPVAAICHAPWLLIETGVAEGRTLTGYKSIHTDLKNAGATVKDEAPVVDGNLVTARNPDDLPAFNEAFLKKLAEVVPA